MMIFLGSTLIDQAMKYMLPATNNDPKAVLEESAKLQPPVPESSILNEATRHHMHQGGSEENIDMEDRHPTDEQESYSYMSSEAGSAGVRIKDLSEGAEIEVE